MEIKFEKELEQLPSQTKELIEENYSKNETKEDTKKIKSNVNLLNVINILIN